MLVVGDCGMVLPCIDLLSMDLSASRRLGTPVLGVGNCGMAEAECGTLILLQQG